MPTIETSLGPIPIRGEITNRPKVLAITGALAAPEDMSRLPQAVGPDWDGLVADLPGNRAPYLKDNSLAGWTRAFDEVVDKLGTTIVLGQSVGGLISLGMRAPRHVIALDPPLVTAKLWPMIQGMQRLLQANPHEAVWINEIFGVYEDHVEGRDYRSLLTFLSCPADVICGDEPLMPERPVSRYPSFVDEPERDLIRQHVPLHLAPNCGHAVHAVQPGLVVQTVAAAMRGVRAPHG